MTESEARGAARRQIGNLTLRQEEARETWIARWLSDLIQDAIYAARTLRKQPGFAAVAIISAALGIGACSSIFAIANFALFRPLQVSDPSRLVSVSGEDLRGDRMGQSVSYPDFEDLRKARSFQGMTVFFPALPAAISAGGEAQRYWGSLVRANYFDVVRPVFVIGRGFDAARDDRKGEAPAVVLSYQGKGERGKGKGGERGGKGTECAGINRHVVGDEGALQERRSDSIRRVSGTGYETPKLPRASRGSQRCQTERFPCSSAISPVTRRSRPLDHTVVRTVTARRQFPNGPASQVPALPTGPQRHAPRTNL